MPDTFTLIAEGDGGRYTVDFKDIPHGSLPADEVADPGDIFVAELRGRPGDRRARQGRPPMPMVLALTSSARCWNRRRHGRDRSSGHLLVTGRGLRENPCPASYSRYRNCLPNFLVHVPPG